MAGFVQIVEFKTTRLDEGQKLIDEYNERTAGKRASSRAMLLSDRDNPNSYFAVVEFASWEDAQRNNELPETQELSQKLDALTDGGTTFHNFDVVRIDED
jgi:hypothetical protein